MSSKKKSNLFKTFAFRLTLWYSVLFILSVIIIFFISYKVLTLDLIHEVDRELIAATTKIDDEFKVQGLDQVKLDIRGGIEEEGTNRVFYRLMTPELNIVVTSDPLKWPCLNFPILSQWASAATHGKPLFSTISPKDIHYKVRILSRAVDDGKYIVQMGKPMKDEEQLVKIYTKVFLGSVGVLLIFGVFLSWLEAQKAMNGIRRITTTAKNIGQGEIKQRVARGREGEEIEDLAQTFNLMLDQIEHLMMGLKDVTNNIAHDLRTPLMRIRGVAESTLGQTDVQTYHASMGAIVDECDRLNQMINTMLEIAEADAGLKSPQIVSIDLVALGRQAIELFSVVAQDKGIELEFFSSFPSIVIEANPSRLQRVIANLLDNAIKFTESKGNVRLEINQDNKETRIIVEDTGIGIDPHDYDRIFEKFYRIESSRSTPGYGLGLSYVKSMVASLGGTITVHNSSPKGTAFIITIPR